MSWLEKLQRPRPPRKQVLYFAQDELINQYFAVIRFTWFCDGKICGVTETALHNCDLDVIKQLTVLIRDALRDGADVSTLCIAPADELGLEPT